jgi:peptide/nickel transport system ATP-binding protein
MSQLVDIAGLNIRFTGGRTVYAVNDLSLSLGKRRCSGCSANPVRARASPCVR